MISFVSRTLFLGVLIPSLLAAPDSSALTLGPGEFLTGSGLATGTGVRAYTRLGSSIAGSSRNSLNGVLGGYAPLVACATSLDHGQPVSVSLNESFDITADLRTAGFVGEPDVKLHYREGGAAAAMILDPVAAPIDGMYRFRIPGTVVAECGTEYYVMTTIGSLCLSDPPHDPDGTPHQVPTRLSDYSPGSALDTQAKTYRMISFAAQLTPNTITGTLEDDLGPWDDAVWRFGRYDPETDGYREYKGTEAQTDPLSAGNAFWLISRDPKTLDLSGRSRLPDATSAGYSGFEITLKPGWNQIGNPFAFRVDLRQSSVRIGGSILPWSSAIGTVFEPDPLREFDPATTTYSRSSILDPWTGYFVANADPQGRDVVLVIPHRSANGPQLDTIPSSRASVATTSSDRAEPLDARHLQAQSRTRPPARGARAVSPVPADDLERADVIEADHAGLASPDDPCWLLDVRATLQGQERSVTIGLLADASSGLDRADILAPPLPPDGRLALYAENGTLPRGARRMLRDLRSWDRDRIEAKWELVVASADGGNARLDLTMTENLPGDVVACLVDLETTEQIPVSADSRYGFVLAPGLRGRHFVVLVGSERFIDAESAAVVPPSFAFALYPVRPNPVRSSAFVRFSLPSRGETRVRIYDVAGRLVKDLVRQDMPTGLHTIVWDLRSAGGAFTASGTYYVRLDSCRSTQVQRVTVLR